MSWTRPNWISRLTTQQCLSLHRNTHRKTSAGQVITLTNWSITTQVIFQRSRRISYLLQIYLLVIYLNQISNKIDKEAHQLTHTLRKVASPSCRRHNRNAKLMLYHLSNKLISKAAHKTHTLMNFHRVAIPWCSKSKTRVKTHPTREISKKWPHQIRPVQLPQALLTSKK